METDTVDNALELRKYLVQVQSRIREEITSDFTLANVDENQKNSIIEITTNAFEATKRFDNIMKAKNWTWTKNGWKTTETDQDGIKKIKNNQRQSFDSYMNRIFMTVNMNRNKRDNRMVDLLAEEARRDIDAGEDQGTIQKIMDKLAMKKEER